MSAKRASFIQGMIAGAALMAAAMAGYAYGELSGSDWDDEAALETRRCTVRVGTASMAPNNRCFRNDEVMVGLRGEFALCAELTVTCE